MKLARILVLGVALAAGGIAAYLASQSSDAPPPAPEKVEAVKTTEVLVAAGEIPLGTTVAAKDMRWQVWPVDATGAGMVLKTEKPNGIEEFTGGIARVPMMPGELGSIADESAPTQSRCQWL